MRSVPGGVATLAHSIDRRLDDTDVLVVGGGIVGCSVAYYLAREGVAVTLIERHDVGGEASGANAGSIHLQLPSPLFRTAAPAVAARIASALIPFSLAARDAWRDLARDLDNGFELRFAGGLMVAETASELEMLRAKATLERQAGLEVRIVEGRELRELAPYLSDAVCAAAYCPLEGKANPLRALEAILREALRAGAKIRARMALLGMARRSGGFVAATDRGEIRCRRIVNAAGAWAPTVGAMAGLAVPGVVQPQHMNVTEMAPPVLTHLVQHVLRRLTLKQAENGTVVIGGGWRAAADRRPPCARVIADSVTGNLAVATRIVPAVGALRLVRAWAGQSLMTDGNAIVGEPPDMPGFFNAIPANSGFTTGPLTARVVAEALMGRTTRDLAPYSIDRFAPVAGPDA